jgi:hypothetical protein
VLAVLGAQPAKPEINLQNEPSFRPREGRASGTSGPRTPHPAQPPTQTFFIVILLGPRQHGGTPLWLPELTLRNPWSSRDPLSKSSAPSLALSVPAQSDRRPTAPPARASLIRPSAPPIKDVARRGADEPLPSPSHDIIETGLPVTAFLPALCPAPPVSTPTFGPLPCSPDAGLVAPFVLAALSQSDPFESPD